MAEYDLIIKALAERYINQIASFVRGIDVTVEQVEDKDKEAVAVQRTSDALVKVREEGYEYLMLVEFQARPDRKMARRLLEYTAMHHRRHEKPVYPVVINLTGGGRRDDRYIIECLDLTVVDFNYRMINLEDVAGRDLLYRGPVGLLPLAPLMRQDEPPEAVLEKCASRLESEVQVEEERATLYLALGVLAALKFQKSLVQKILEVSMMENSPFFDGIREEWEARGEKRGDIKGRLDMLFDEIEAKFGKMPDDLRMRLGALKEPDEIKQVARKARGAETIDEFLTKLEN